MKHCKVGVATAVEAGSAGCQPDHNTGIRLFDTLLTANLGSSQVTSSTKVHFKGKPMLRSCAYQQNAVMFRVAFSSLRNVVKA